MQILTIPGLAIRRFRRQSRCLLLVVLLFTPAVWASIVTVPLTVDYPLLRQLLVKQLFDTPDGSRDVLDDPAGCSSILLKDPAVAARGEDLEVLAHVRATLGVPAVGGCKALLNWQGSIGVLARPVIQAGGRSLRMDPTDTWLVEAGGKKLTSGSLWTVADASLRSFFSGFILDLDPQLDSLGALLPDLLPRHSVQEIQAIADSVKLSRVEVTPASLNALISLEVATAVPEAPAEPVLSAEELQQWEERWQLMDALLVVAVKRYASATDQQALRSALLDILIDSRYRLRDALASPATRSDDQVRAWFLHSWQRLSPVVRSIALEQEGQEHLLWFSVLTSMDALHALDQLGPGIGLEISADGLRRLARMINGGQAGEPLRYDEQVDPELQRLFYQQFRPAAAEPAALRFDFSLVPSAMANSPASRLNQWVPDTSELGDYLPLVAELLQENTEDVLGTHRLEQQYHGLYRNLVLATAWQESCWRQYVVKDQQRQPLRSGTGDVGLMQINERVWRGFYDLHQLRWDIDYNSMAGAEVLFDYLVKYALPKGEQRQPGGPQTLARASYSAYNGGPSQVSRYRRSGVAAAHRKVDAAFWEKYQQVAAGNAMGVARCLGGESAVIPQSVSAVKSTTSSAKTAGAKPLSPTSNKPLAGQAWVLAQNELHFTLQLGAFSEPEFARTFMQQEGLASAAHVYPQRRAGVTRFLVLYGSYAKRSAADPVKQRFGHLKPWLRSFKDLRKPG